MSRAMTLECDGNPVEGEIVDLSLTGFGATVAGTARLSVGQVVKVAFTLGDEGIERTARVRWTSGSHAGLAFDVPLPAKIAVVLRQHLGAG